MRYIELVMPRCSTPDRLIGIGGGGSRVVYRFMQQDWILEEVMKTDEYNEPEPDILRATVIDSATDDKFHSERAPLVEKKVNGAYEGTDKNPRYGYVEFDGPHIITETVPGRWLGSDLTSEMAVRELCDNQDLTSWWLAEGREPLSKINEKGFGGGVLRRRSMSKLLFHVAEDTHNSVIPNNNDEEQVYIVAALGGGTGSGMALDLASELQNGDKQIHLVGILPHDRAGGLEKTNAHAALSELEYAHLTGEGPFETMTLIPHLEQLEDHNRDFEMGVVRSIIAHQNGIRSGNFTTHITPTQDIATNPPNYTPFTLAAPYTIKFNLKRREVAEEAVTEILDAKEKELQRESDLYEVIEKYLTEAFRNSAGDEFESVGEGSLDTEWGREAAHQLRQRVEDDIRETFLNEEALQLANLGNLVDEIKESIDSAPHVNVPGAERNDDLETDINPMSEAVDFVNETPGIILDRLNNKPEFTAISPDDQLQYDLVEVLKAEFQNVQKRAEIWRAVAAITPENTNLDKGEAEVVRTAIREVIMNPETELLTDRFRDPTLKRMINDWRTQRKALDTAVEKLTDFYETIGSELETRTNEWNETAYDNTKSLAAINEHEENIEAAIDDLIDEIKTEIQRIEESSTVDAVDAVSLDNVGPLDEMKIEGVAPLNDKLNEIGVAEIDIETIKQGFKFVKDARKDKIKHGGSIFFGGEDRSDEFATNVTSARETGPFEINPNSPNPSIEETFSCQFKGDRLRRKSEIESQREELIEDIVDAFELAFSTDDGFVSENLTYSTDGQSESTKTISLPQELNLDNMRVNVRQSLRENEATEPEVLLKETLSLNEINITDPTTVSDDSGSNATRMLVEAYLRPVEKEVKKSQSRLEKLGGQNDRSSTGLIQRFELLRGLSKGRVELANVDLPQTDDLGREETYGRQFTRKYQGRYEIELSEEMEKTQIEDHPYVLHEEADQELVAGTHDIAESDILDDATMESKVVSELQNSVRFLTNNRYGRAPINELKPKAKGKEVKPSFGNIRVNPVYMSRAYDEHDELSEYYTDVRNQFEKEIEVVNNDMYTAATHEAGDRDEVTMVTFIGGLFLDNLELLTKRNGYKDVYDRSEARGFIAAHHTIGVGGNWSRWRTMKKWAIENDNSNKNHDFGAYVSRDKVRDVDEEFMSEVMIADQSSEGTDPEDLFLDMLSVNTYQSTYDITRKPAESDD